jgi:hypothetical protein
MGPLDRALGLEIPGRVQWEPLEVQAQGPVQVPLDKPWPGRGRHGETFF